jgi:hypothetical protein
LLEELRSATSTLLRLTQLILSVTSRNIHYRFYP